MPQAILLRDAAQLAQAEAWINAILERQTAEGWMGPPDAERGDAGMRYWPQWPIVLSFLAWHDYGKAVNGTADPRLLASCLAWMHNASGMLAVKPMGRDWSGTRWQDFVQAVQAVMDCPETPASEQAFLQALSATAYEQGTKNGLDWAKYYAGPDFPKDAVGGWDYPPHGVNNGMAAKGGAVTWRGGLDPEGNVSSYVRDSMLMTYHGSPAGIFTADECLAGRMPSKGTETCAVVEQLYSLNVVHEIQGDPFFADRAERIAYNALPATGTKDMCVNGCARARARARAAARKPRGLTPRPDPAAAPAGGRACTSSSKTKFSQGTLTRMCGTRMARMRRRIRWQATTCAAPPISTRAGAASSRTCCTRRPTAGWP